jgi:hypothetical protein
MARVIRQGNELVLQLSFWEKLGALNLSPRTSINSVEKIEFVDELWGSSSLRGVRAPGTAIPYVVVLGTLRGVKYKDFVAMKGKGEGVVITLKSGPFARWIFTLKQAKEDIQLLHSLK